ncbi:MAG: GNAT family N-acetyltransferase [Acidobacteriia bacterium]|nr:GNAT family N-acetyltransferase [Terriglobia bacterium]
MSLTFPISVSEDIAIRLAGAADSKTLFGLVERNRLRLGRHLPWVERTISTRQVSAFLRIASRQHAAGDGFHACIEVAGQLVGMIGLHPIDWLNRSVALGYWIDHGCQGRGVVTACCREVVRICFEHYDLHRVEIRCATTNRRSCAVARRLGFRREGVLRGAHLVGGRYLDMVVYGKLKGSTA